MIALLFILSFLVCFIIPAFYGAPYVPTLKKFVPTALDMLDLKQGQTVLELGCGDGRVVKAAAQRGYSVVGYELNPYLAVIAWIRTLGYRKQVKIVWGNFMKKQLPSADAVFCFIMPKFMPAIDRKIEESQLPPIKLVSFSIPIPHKEPTLKSNNVLLYVYED